MTTNPSTWRIEGTELVEQPTMKEPKTSDFYGRKFSTDMDSVDYRSFNEAVSQYKKHLASLRRFPHNLPDSLQGVDLIEGTHFKLGYQQADIYSRTGTKVIAGFKNGELQNGYDHDKTFGEKYLKPNVVYTIEKTEVEGWHTDFYLQELPGVFFNSVHFLRADPVALPIPQPEQPISEEGKDILGFMKFLETNRLFSVSEVREWLKLLDKEEISFSKFVELFNEKFYNLYKEKTPSPSQEAIELAYWKKRAELAEHFIDVDPLYMSKKDKEKWSEYTEHKNSK